MPHETLPPAHAPMLMPMRIDVMCGRDASAALHQGEVLCHPAELTLRAVARDARLHVEAERVVGPARHRFTRGAHEVRAFLAWRRPPRAAGRLAMAARRWRYSAETSRFQTSVCETQSS